MTEVIPSHDGCEFSVARIKGYDFLKFRVEKLPLESFHR
jgi:hypothetical protein